MWQYGFGIPDELFIRGDVPMTKQEIRAIALSKMRLKQDSIVWDIGAGTGSISIESAVYCKQGKAFAIEKDADAISLIKKNRDAFGTRNLEIAIGEAPEALANLPTPDRIFIGGTGDKTREVLNAAVNRLSSGGIIVVTAITTETVYMVQEFFKAHSWNLDMILVNIAVSRNAGQKTLMLARNPVYILTAQGPLSTTKLEDTLYGQKR